MTNYTTISITMDGTWAGSGKLRREDDYVIIEDCGAQFCDNNDWSLRIYDLIEEAIAAGKSKQLQVEIDGEAHEITWSIPAVPIFD